ncbi:MAG: hypothetical protein ACXVFQ_13710 [Solirubrobacteraceae bacterium]
MFRKRSARALAGGLSIVFLLVAASSAYAFVTGRFSGLTGQKQSISFHVGHGNVTNLEFHIKDTCPSGHVYGIHDFNFPSIKISASHKFDGRFKSTTTNAQVEITGTVHSKQVKGQIIELRRIKGQTCAGKARYTVRKQ